MEGRASKVGTKTRSGSRSSTMAFEHQDDAMREREGLEMVAAGLRQGLMWMPASCSSRRALQPLLADLEQRLEEDPSWPALPTR
jgi:hypothetical protein